jgi:hypothetical protein
MRKKFLACAGAVIVFFVVACSTQHRTSTNYYFDPVAGNDSNAGTSPEHAFKTLGRIKALKIAPGDSILLKSGALFTEQFYISCKGDSAKPIVVGKYGGDERPHVKGDASNMQAVHIFNSENIVVRDLEVSNKGTEPVDGLNGVLVELLNYGTAKNITLDNLFVHDVYGMLVRENKGGGNGIKIENFHDEKTDSISSRFDELLIQNCYVKNCQRNGINMWGNWIRKKWNPNLHVVIRHNVIDGVPGDGIVPVACESPLVEYNIMKNSPRTLPASEACDGIWPWSCDNAIVQYNIVSDHKSQVDGYGFDSDWNSTNSIFQYNLSYNNDGGFLLLCNSGGWPTDWSIGNIGTIVRYNISINDGLRNYSVPKSKRKYFSPVIHITGPTKNSLIEKNIFYIFKKTEPQIDKTFVSLTDWSGYPDSTFFSNNYFFVGEPNIAVDSTKSTNNFYEGNKYVGPLAVFSAGFTEYNGTFDQAMWYNSSDENWKKLLQFIDEKTVPVNGTQLSVKDIIGYNKTVNAR